MNYCGALDARGSRLRALVIAYLSCPFWGKVCNFRGLFAFLLHYVATRNMAYIKSYLDYNQYMGYLSSHYVYRYLAHHPGWQNLYAASAARVVSRPRQGPPPHDCPCQSLFRCGDPSAAVGRSTQV